MAIGSRSAGEWVSVINKQRNKMGGLRNNNQSLFTLFIDNLAEEVNQIWLRKIFSNYGVVKDTFIPNKRSKRTGSKFGFVRYDCHVSAGVAISKANGLWVSDKKLFIKEASFDQSKNKLDLQIPLLQRPDGVPSSNGLLRNQGFHCDTDKSGHLSLPHGKSFAQMVSGETNTSGEDGKQTDKVLNCSNQGCRRVSLKPIGNGWLYRSAVAKLHKLISINELKGQMKGMGLDNVDIKALGGRSVILTCPSKDEMEMMIKERCLQRWFSETIPWDGQAACAERFVWLCCYGIPLNVWSNISFKSIGELWGSFISTDESTMKMSSFAEAKILIATNIFKEIDEWIIVEVEGKSYKVKVMEDFCDQPNDAEKQIPRVSLTSPSDSDEVSKTAMEDCEDEVDRSMSGSETLGPFTAADLVARNGSGRHVDSPIYNEVLEVADKVVNLGGESNDNSMSSHGLESIVEDSMGLLSLFQEVEDTGSKPQGDKLVSHTALMVTDPRKLITEGNEAWNKPIVLDSGNNIRASQVVGINLMVDFGAPVINEKNRSQLFSEDLDSIESSRSSVPSQDVSGYIADTLDREQYKIAEEIQETMKTGTKLGLKFDDAGVLRMKKMIEEEAKDMELLRDNRFAPLLRNKHHRNESRDRQSSSLVF